MRITMKTFFRLRKFLLAALLVGCASLTTSCSNETQKVEAVYIPLLAGKEQEVTKYIDSLDPGEEVNAEIIHFDMVLDSHRDVIGFIKLTSTTMSPRGLITHSNAIHRIQSDSGLAKKRVKKKAKKSGEMSDKNEQYTVGLIRQTNGDLESAIHLFKLSAAQGYDMAQYSLGNIYFRGGEGVAQDYPEALKWYLMAAEQGNVSAQVVAGAMYARGNGTKQDHVEANRWFLRAGNKGDAVAQFNMGMAYDNGLGVKTDHAQAFNWFLKSAENGVAQAQVTVGGMYAEGRGVKQDPVKAYSWIDRAAEEGFPPAITALEEVAKTMTPEQLSAAQNESATTP
jgi:TPR repeat protein